MGWTYGNEHSKYHYSSEDLIRNIEIQYNYGLNHNKYKHHKHLHTHRYL